jgi:hypothetical protein
LPGFVISAIVAWSSSSGFMNPFLLLGYRSSKPATEYALPQSGATGDGMT